MANPFEGLTDPLYEVKRAEKALAQARSNAMASAKRKGQAAEALFAESRFVLRSNAERWVDQAYENGRKAERDQLLAALSKPRDAPSPFKGLGKFDWTSPEGKALGEQYEAGMALFDSPALSKFPPEKRAKIALAWAREEGDLPPPKDKSMSYESDIKTNALRVVNAGRRARGLPLLPQLETDEGGDEPAPRDIENYRDTSEEDYEPDPDRPGKVRRKKKAKDEIRPDEPEQPRIPTSEEQEETNGRALQLINCGRMVRGLKPLTRAEFIVINRDRGK